MTINWGSFLLGGVTVVFGMWLYYNVGPKIGFGLGKGSS